MNTYEIWTVYLLCPKHTISHLPPSSHEFELHAHLCTIKCFKSDCCRCDCHEVLDFCLSQMTSRGCFYVILGAESALCCHAGDWNYKHHFVQSLKSGSFSPSEVIRSQQDSERGLSCLQEPASVVGNPAICAPSAPVDQLHQSVTRSVPIIGLFKETSDT